MDRRINKYELEKELKKALHNRKQDNARFMFYDDFLTIEYDVTYDWIFAEWKGDQTENSLKIGLGKLYDALRVFPCSKILSDSTNVLSLGTPVLNWIETTWLPMLCDAGLKYLAWVFPAETISPQHSVQTKDPGSVLQTFQVIENARQWLQSR